MPERPKVLVWTEVNFLRALSVCRIGHHLDALFIQLVEPGNAVRERVLYPNPHFGHSAQPVAQRRFIAAFDDIQILQPLEQEIFVLWQLLKDGVAAAVVQQTDAGRSV